MRLVLPTVDRESAEPLYLQIRRAILQSIHAGDLTPHQRVPSERELSEAMGISRMTVRQALQTLINDGYLYTVPGKGTFVGRDPKIEQNLQRLSGFTEEVRAQGFRAGSRLLDIAVVPAEAYQARHLKVTEGTPLFRISRQRLVDSVPVAVEHAYLITSKFPGLDQVDLEKHSLYAVLQGQYGAQLVRAEQWIEAREANAQVAPLLDITPGAPVLAMERVTYTHSGQPVEFVVSFYRADRFRLKVELRVGSIPHEGAVSKIYRP